MAASILNSNRAIAISVYVIRAFVELRDKLTANRAILKRLAEIDHDLMIHDTALQDNLRKVIAAARSAAGTGASANWFLFRLESAAPSTLSSIAADRRALSGARAAF